MEIYIFYFIYFLLPTGFTQNSHCGGDLTNHSGEIRFNQYASYSNLNCEWNIKSPNSEDHVYIKIGDRFELGPGDYLSAHDYSINTELFKFTGNTPTMRSIHSFGNPVGIKFHVSARPYYDDDYGYSPNYFTNIISHGFTLTYNRETKCKTQDLLQDLEGEINSYNIRETLCGWTLSPPEDKFDYFQIQLQLSNNPECKNTQESYQINDADGIRNLNFTECRESGTNKTNFKIYSFDKHPTVEYRKQSGTYMQITGKYKTLRFKKYGEPCSKENEDLCDPFKMTLCKEGICSCPLPHDQMYYSEDVKACISRFKMNCSIPGGLFQEKWNTSKCVDTTICVGGICECNPNTFYEDFEGICQPKKEFGANCNRTVECNENKSLTCLPETEKCGCNSLEGRVVDKEDVKCIGQLNRDCVKGLCIENAECAENKCQCKRGFTESSGGECLRNYGEVCSVDAPCSDLQFYCINGFCKCKSPSRKRYDQEKEKCLSNLYGDCELKEDCYINMDCGIKSGSHYTKKQCLCSQGFISDKNGNCYPSFGTECDKTQLGGICDPLAMLDCINGRCACFDELHVYSSTQRSCLGSIGAICKNDTDCMQSLSCHKDWEIMLFGRCELDKNFASGQVAPISPKLTFVALPSTSFTPKMTERIAISSEPFTSISYWEITERSEKLEQISGALRISIYSPILIFVLHLF